MDEIMSAMDRRHQTKNNKLIVSGTQQRKVEMSYGGLCSPMDKTGFIDNNDNDVDRLFSKLLHLRNRLQRALSLPKLLHLFPHLSKLVYIRKVKYLSKFIYVQSPAKRQKKMLTLILHLRAFHLYSDFKGIILHIFV